MTPAASRVHLFNVTRNEPETAELWDAITERQLADWESEWMPALFDAIRRLNRARVERRQWPQSRHWNWRRKVETLQGMLANPGFSIVCDGLTQGMMIVDTAKHRCRIDSQRGPASRVRGVRRERTLEPPGVVHSSAIPRASVAF